MQVGLSLNSSLLRISGQEVNSAQKNSQSQEEQNELTPSEKQLISKLEATDKNVREHEAAHIAAGQGVVTGGANFTYQTGPDHKQYAIGGEVPIDASTENTPEDTISKMQKVQTAAMAPKDPSPTDYKVASTARMLEFRAQLELNKEQQEESQGEKENPYIRVNGTEKDTSSELDLVA